MYTLVHKATQKIIRIKLLWQREYDEGILHYSNLQSRLQKLAIHVY